MVILGLDLLPKFNYILCYYISIKNFLINFFNKYYI